MPGGMGSFGPVEAAIAASASGMRPVWNEEWHGGRRGGPSIKRERGSDEHRGAREEPAERPRVKRERIDELADAAHGMAQFGGTPSLPIGSGGR